MTAIAITAGALLVAIAAATARALIHLAQAQAALDDDEQADTLALGGHVVLPVFGEHPGHRSHPSPKA
jgi:hypothetical protein